MSVIETVMSLAETVMSKTDLVNSVSQTVMLVTDWRMSVAETVMSVTDTVISVTETVMSVIQTVISVRETVISHGLIPTFPSDITVSAPFLAAAKPSKKRFWNPSAEATSCPANGCYFECC
jgi:phage-related protein